jgi:CRP-like cAMP-binding protein
MQQKSSEWFHTLKSKYPIVNDTEWELLDKITKVRVVKKGESFLLYGKIARYSAFVLSGHFKYTIIGGDGTENIIRFAFATDFLANCESYYRNSPSTISITALEKFFIRRIDIKRLQPLYNLHMSLSEVNLQIYREIAELSLEHQHLLSLKSPIRRYEFLLKHRPAIIKKISLTNIARYLYVSREALSRARMILLNKPGNFCD